MQKNAITFRSFKKNAKERESVAFFWKEWISNTGGERVNLPSAKKFFIAAMLFWDEDDICTLIFHSVIFNYDMNQLFLAETAYIVVEIYS